MATLGRYRRARPTLGLPRHCSVIVALSAVTEHRGGVVQVDRFGMGRVRDEIAAHQRYTAL
jgi:hypothetical protein